METKVEVLESQLKTAEEKCSSLQNEAQEVMLGLKYYILFSVHFAILIFSYN